MRPDTFTEVCLTDLHCPFDFRLCRDPARTVREAVALLRTSHVDVVLLDSILPDGLGAEVSGVAEAIGSVVIHMSGYPQQIEELQRSKHVFLCKPFGPAMLLSTIENAIHSLSEPTLR